VKWGKFFGGVLLVAGTTIGVGMLGLPVVTGFTGLIPSVILFLIIWMFMMFTGIFFVEINCSMKGQVNLVTMAEKTLGPWGRALSWVAYLLLLYSLMSAYIAASAPLFVQAFDGLFGLALPMWISKFLLPLFFGGFIYLGTRGVDLVNRVMMFFLVCAYILLVVTVPEHIAIENLTRVDWKPFVYAAPVIITAFGYHIIIPSLTTYLDHDKKALMGVVVVGSIIALIVNLVWQVLVLGVVPLIGSDGLATAWLDGSPSTGPLAAAVHSPMIATGAYFFSFFAIITSFLGVALSLADFLTDGLKIKKTWEGRLMAICLTFIPPLVFVFSYQRGFLLALEYAGAFVAILLVFLPTAMMWTLKKPKFFRNVLGRTILIASFGFSLFIIVVNLMIKWGYFDPIFKRLALS